MNARRSMAVLYNAPTLPPDHPDARSEADVVDVAHAVAAVLFDAGHDPRLIPAEPPVDRLIHMLTHPRPEVVFNLIEGFAGLSGGEGHVTSLLELLGLAYTGCPPSAQLLCHSKARTKLVLRGAGLPTAPAFVWTGGSGPVDLGFAGPYFVKPEAEDASLGIDQGSVVATPEQAVRRAVELGERYGPGALIEAYLPGPEYNVGLLGRGDGVRALAVAEVVYKPAPGEWPILTYAAKWHDGSAADLASPVRCPAVVDEGVADELRRLAILAFEATGCRDCARVDFRLDAGGRPMILEVNPNPDLGPNAGWARAVGASGLDYAATIAGLVERAMPAL